MNNVVYILVREDNQAFLGAYATLADAEQMAKVFRVPTEILHWRITQDPLPSGKLMAEYSVDKRCPVHPQPLH